MYEIKITINEENAINEGFNNIEHAEQSIEGVLTENGIKPVTTTWFNGSKWFNGDMTACLVMISTLGKEEWFLNSVDDWILLNANISSREDLLEEYTGRASLSLCSN